MRERLIGLNFEFAIMIDLSRSTKKVEDVKTRGGMDKV